HPAAAVPVMAAGAARCVRHPRRCADHAGGSPRGFRRRLPSLPHVPPPPGHAAVGVAAGTLQRAGHGRPHARLKRPRAGRRPARILVCYLPTTAVAASERTMPAELTPGSSTAACWCMRRPASAATGGTARLKVMAPPVPARNTLASAL